MKLMEQDIRTSIYKLCNENETALELKFQTQDPIILNEKLKL